jgi:hypothetical protein
MRAHGHGTIGGAHIGGGRAGGSVAWHQLLRDWWTAHKPARREERRASINACWDPKRETVRPLGTEAAIETAVAQGTLSIATQPYGLAL